MKVKELAILLQKVFCLSSPETVEHEVTIWDEREQAWLPVDKIVREGNTLRLLCGNK